MTHCILGAIMYCTAVFTIRGDVSYGPVYSANEPWRYAVWYQPPLRTQSFPAVFPIARRG